MEFGDLISIPRIEGVILHTPFKDAVEVTACITGHHLILSSRKDEKHEIWVLHQCIDTIEKKLNGANLNTGGLLTLKCKDFRIITLDILSTEDLINAQISLERLCSVENPLLLYPFFFTPQFNILEDGHTLYKPDTEYAKLLASDEWRLSNINKDYSVCPTYAQVLIVPKSIDDETIAASANFREGGRFPILSYRHDNGAILLRSSQPLLNNVNKRSRSDEKILNAILGAHSKGYIVDTRSVNYSNQCKTKGGGTEPEGNYPQWKRTHKNLDKISSCNGTLLDSFIKLFDAINDTTCSSDKWLSRLESSNWLGYIQNCLDTACVVAQSLHQDKVSVLVHGTNGLDSTLLVTSIAQIILNPDCRTIRGLQALIEREWIQAGHPFQTRHSKSCYSNGKNKQSQPTFLLFLDCIQQLHHQFPCSFEFNTQTLILFFEHSYFSQFGTFLGNCEADRNKLQVPKNTISLWSYLNRPEVLASLLNPMYEPNNTTIWPSVASVSVVLWSNLYLRWIIDQSQNKKALSKVQNLIHSQKDRRSKATKLRKQLLELQQELISLTVKTNAYDTNTEAD